MRACFAGAAAVLALSGALLAGCSSGPGQVTSHGTVEVDYDSGGTDNLSGGDQVTVVDSAGTVVGNATLSAAKSGTSPLGIGEQDQFTFKVTVPAGLPRYGIQVGGTGHGTLWQSEAQMKAGPGVEIDETTNGGF